MYSDPAAVIIADHYTHSIPAGKTLTFEHEDAIVMFSIPANYNISRWMLGERNRVWELSRLWAPDGHRPNLLTQALASATAEFKGAEQGVWALVSYADPNAGHLGGVYRAASWTYLGISAESRMYRDGNGNMHPRRKFHQGRQGMTKSEIESLGYQQVNLPGKHRFGKGLTKQARKRIATLRRELNV